ncbi:P2Y purinoceptor 8, partial [Nannospalax galili]|uniref:P2Y purinoceptor 8 n=1 Tax=Nannospalax galili TaxID=1026970 RepID=UPI000819D673
MEANATGPDNATLQMLQSRALAVALPAVYSLVALVGIPGNALALWVLCRHVRPKAPCVIFMINLSITDLLLALVLPVQAAYHRRGPHWAFGPALCSAVTLAFYVNMYGSIVSMTYISVDRCLAVVRPLTSARWRRRRYALAACVTSWLLLGATLTPLARTDLTYHVRALGVVTCFDVLPWRMLPGPAAWAAFLLGVFAVLFLVPFAVTVGCYAATIARLRRGAH